MKRKLCILLVIITCTGLYGCNNSSDVANNTSNTSTETTNDTQSNSSSDKSIDVDLTKLSSTMVYSEVYNMLCEPEEYNGKIIKMRGKFSYYHDDATGLDYFDCYIADAAACCQQGLEFVRAGDFSYPEDYPEQNSMITVIGTFDAYKENNSVYCRITDATME